MQEQFECHSCRRQCSCLKCNDKWHGKDTCEEAKEKKKVALALPAQDEAGALNESIGRLLTLLESAGHADIAAAVEKTEKGQLFRRKSAPRTSPDRSAQNCAEEMVTTELTAAIANFWRDDNVAGDSSTGGRGIRPTYFRTLSEVGGPPCTVCHVERKGIVVGQPVQAASRRADDTSTDRGRYRDVHFATANHARKTGIMSRLLPRAAEVLLQDCDELRFHIAGNADIVRRTLMKCDGQQLQGGHLSVEGFAHNGTVCGAFAMIRKSATFGASPQAEQVMKKRKKTK